MRTSLVAAASSYALAGGRKLAMVCEIVIASAFTLLGQPEITLGILPGISETQRLVGAVGKTKAMELILTERISDAHEADRGGLASRIVATAGLLDAAHKRSRPSRDLRPRPPRAQ